MKTYEFWAYIMGSKSGTLYVGFTNHLYRRVHQHKTGYYPKSFSKRYNCRKLLYFEKFQYVYDALDREKQIKRWNRLKKVRLLERFNPSWRDLSLDFEVEHPPT